MLDFVRGIKPLPRTPPLYCLKCNALELEWHAQDTGAHHKRRRAALHGDALALVPGQKQKGWEGKDVCKETSNDSKLVDTIYHPHKWTEPLKAQRAVFF